MPPLASSVLDTNAILLLSAWITNDLPAWQRVGDRIVDLYDRILEGRAVGT